MELCFLSAARHTSAPPGCALTFSIPDLIQSLPVWRLWDRDITPFRDRTMVEKISSIPEIQEDLKRIMDDIDKELHKRIPIEVSCEDSDVVICITCQEGTRVSPCYVEKLYEEYSHRESVRELAVKRRHLRISPYEGRQPNRGKLFVWQRIKIPLNVRKFEDLTVEKLWSTFPFHTSNVLEEGFKKDPFNGKFQIVQSSGSDIFNFETGEMYRANKMYRFRCAVSVIDDRIPCKMLGNASYKSSSKHYDAAGILFYSTHPITAEPVFLLGHMTYSTECWCDFGGLKHFRERPRRTAARECAEETFGVLGGVEQLFQMLANYKTNNVFKVVNEDTSYVSHFMWVPYQGYPRHFSRVIEESGEASVEMDEMRWFSLPSLVGAARTFAMQLSNLAHPILENGNIDKTCHCPLRYEFLQTLCIAEKLSFLRHIQHICTQRHAHSPQCKSKSNSGTKMCSISEVRTGMEQGEHCCGLEGKMELLAGSSGRDPDSLGHIGGPPSAGVNESNVASTSGEGVKDQSRTKYAVAEGGGVTGTDAEGGGVTGTDADVGGVTGTDTEGGGVTGTDAKEGGVTGRTKHRDILYYGMGAGNFMLLH